MLGIKEIIKLDVGIHASNISCTQEVGGNERIMNSRMARSIEWDPVCEESEKGSLGEVGGGNDVMKYNA